jgi:thiamine biosynthesis lipoprotein
LPSRRPRAHDTDGAFDPTIAPVVALWRTARKTRTLPMPDARAAAVALRGWRDISIDRVRGTVRRPRPGMALDFGGIGKGYAAERVVGLLQRLPGSLRVSVKSAATSRSATRPPTPQGGASERMRLRRS